MQRTHCQVSTYRAVNELFYMSVFSQKSFQFYVKIFLAIITVGALGIGISYISAYSDPVAPVSDPSSDINLVRPLYSGDAPGVLQEKLGGLAVGGLFGGKNMIVEGSLLVGGTGVPSHSLEVRGDVSASELRDTYTGVGTKVCSQPDGTLSLCAQPGEIIFDNPNDVVPDTGTSEQAEYTWVVPSGVYSIIIEAWGAGGVNSDSVTQCDMDFLFCGGSGGYMESGFETFYDWYLAFHVDPPGGSTSVRLFEEDGATPKTLPSGGSPKMCAAGGKEEIGGTANGFQAIDGANGTFEEATLSSSSNQDLNTTEVIGGYAQSDKSNAGYATKKAYNAYSQSNGKVPGGGAAGFLGTGGRELTEGGGAGGYGRGAVAVEPGDVIGIVVGGKVRDPDLFRNYPGFYFKFYGDPIAFFNTYFVAEAYPTRGYSGAGRVRIQWGVSSTATLACDPTTNNCFTNSSPDSEICPSDGSIEIPDPDVE